jgi:hypothetical protein
MKVGRGADEVKPAGGCIVTRTTSVRVITTMTAVLAVAVAGCSSHRSQVGAGQSVVSSAPGSAQLTSAPTSAGAASSATSAGPASIDPANPVTGSPSVTPVPSVTPSASPVASHAVASHAVESNSGTVPAVPPLGTHAVTVVAGLACPAAGSPGQSTSPSPKPLSPSVAIKAVVRCGTVQRSYPGLGSWNVQLAEVADSGLGPFLADLRAPSDPMPSGIMCPDFRILVPWFELVDSAGAALNVAIPTDQCGAPKTTVITALQALQFRETDAVRLAPSA